MQSSDALYLFNEGRNYQAYRLLGAHLTPAGTVFRVWAPNAGSISVVGDFNGWAGGVDVLHSLGASGVWEATVPAAVPGSLYRFEIINRHSGEKLVKSDPYGRGFELRPGSAAYVVPPSGHTWGDGDWLARRAAWDWQRAPSQYLRSAPRLLDAPPGWQALPVARTDRAPDSLRRRPWALPISSCCRSPSIRWTIPGVTRSPAFTRRPAATARRTIFVLRQRLPPGRHRRDCRLGAGAFPAR